MRTRTGLLALLLPLLLPLLVAACGGREGPTEAAWTNLFDGRSLDGWVTEGGRYDGAADWSTADGVIVGRTGPQGEGGLLYTAETYRDCEFRCECFIGYPFDSGIFLRMGPEKKGAQVTLDYRPGGEIAGIYADGWYLHNPEIKQRWKKDGWNDVRVRCTGHPMRIQVWLDDELVTDYTFPAEKAGEFRESGRIGLQVHGTSGAVPTSKVQFRNLRVRPL